MGGDAGDEIDEPAFAAIRVADLPPPHLPFKCALSARFEAMSEEAGEDTPPLEIGARFIASLTPEDRASCVFHAADWRSIADESVRILDASPGASREAMAARARASALGPVERRWLESIFSQPVSVGGGHFSDGQHRGCALLGTIMPTLRFSGAEEAVVAMG